MWRKQEMEVERERESECNAAESSEEKGDETQDMLSASVSGKPRVRRNVGLNIGEKK